MHILPRTCSYICVCIWKLETPFFLLLIFRRIHRVLCVAGPPVESFAENAAKCRQFFVCRACPYDANDTNREAAQPLMIIEEGGAYPLRPMMHAVLERQVPEIEPVAPDVAADRPGEDVRTPENMVT